MRRRKDDFATLAQRTGRTTDIPAVKAYLKAKIAQVTAADGKTDLGSPWCEEARRLYGEFGTRGMTKYVRERDGSEALPKCWHNNTCLPSNIVTIYLD